MKGLYSQKLSELELEREELQYYKMKFKRKQAESKQDSFANLHTQKCETTPEYSFCLQLGAALAELNQDRATLQKLSRQLEALKGRHMRDKQKLRVHRSLFKTARAVSECVPTESGESGAELDRKQRFLSASFLNLRRGREQLEREKLQSLQLQVDFLGRSPQS